MKETFRVLKTMVREKHVPEFYVNRIERAWMHLLYFLRRNLPLGRLASVSEVTDRQRGVNESFEDTRGYQPLDHEHASDPEARQNFDNPAMWDQRIMELEAAHDGEHVKPVNLPALPYITNLELRYDEDHVNNQGARLWARDLARALAKSWSS